MKNVTKRMATIAGVGIVAVSLAVGVTFVSAQKEKADKFSLLAQNIVALAQNEGIPAGWCVCPVSGAIKEAIFDNRMFCTLPCELEKIFSCPTSSTNNFHLEGSIDRCTK